MNYLIAHANGGFNALQLSDLTPDDSLVLLIAIERDKLAAEFETHMNKIVREAEQLQSLLKQKGVAAKVLIEWGNKEEVIATCLAREQAILLK
ncbi:MAG: hypothetical protein V1835_03650 [Candidatus Micrarchaeota archaeon]